MPHGPWGHLPPPVWVVVDDPSTAHVNIDLDAGRAVQTYPPLEFVLLSHLFFVLKFLLGLLSLFLLKFLLLPHLQLLL